MDQILLISKNSKDIAKMLDLLEGFKESNTDIIYTNNFKDGISKIKKLKFKAIIIDYNKDELESIHLIIESGVNSPIILLANKSDQSDSIKLIEKGIQDILIKWEFDKASLFRSIEFADLRIKSIEKLKDSEEKLKMLFDFAPLGFFLIDMNGKIIEGNKAAEKIFGYYKNELSGIQYFDNNLMSPDQRERAIYLLVCNSIGMPTGPDYFWVKRKTGEKIKVEFFTNSIQINNETYAFGIVREMLGEGIVN